MKALSPDFEAFLLELGVNLTEQNRWLYEHAITHSSYTYELKLSVLENYERLEFLGDAVLKLFVSDYLYQTFPHYREGELTKIRAVIVSDVKLATLCQESGLDEHIVFGPAEAKNKGRQKTSNLACAFEAFLGALYLDNRWDLIDKCLQQLLAEHVHDIDQNKTKDNFKAALQEWCQGIGYGLPEYETVSEVGPSHKKTFEIQVKVRGDVVGTGKGANKKEAQQLAAKNAMVQLQIPIE